MGVGRGLGRAVLLAAAASAAVVPAASAAKPTLKKAMWGPAAVAGQSQFPLYAELGVGLYMTGISWRVVAPTPPSVASDPTDPAYRWPPELDAVVSNAAASGIAV